MGLYERYLAARLRRADADPPAHVALVITERDLLEQGAYDTLEAFLRWTDERAIDRVTIYVSVLDAAAIPTLKREIGSITAPAPVGIRGPDDDAPVEARIGVSIGLGGKHEFTAAVRGIAEGVAAGKIAPAAVDEAEIEDRLVFADEPDLVLKTGAERLSDFMIWQSVYSELYFTDVNWRDFRKRDFLRALMEFASRRRRFGR